MEEVSAEVKKIILSFYDDNPYVQHLQMTIVEAKPGMVKVTMPVATGIHTNAYRVAHGGALMSIADTAMGASCLTVNKKVVTLDMNINCMKAIPENTQITAIGKILHDGTRTVIAECEIVDKDGILYAKARGSFFVIKKFAV